MPTCTYLHTYVLSTEISSAFTLELGVKFDLRKMVKNWMLLSGFSKYKQNFTKFNSKSPFDNTEKQALIRIDLLIVLKHFSKEIKSKKKKSTI